MKKKVLLIVSMCTLFYSATRSQSVGEIEMYGNTNITEKKIEPTCDLYLKRKIHTRFLFITFAMVTQTWAEGLVGIEYKPTKWFSVDIRGGIEQTPALYRVGGKFKLGTEKYETLFFWEKGDGKSNYWYKSISTYRISKPFSLGVIAWRYHATGPYVQYEFEKQKIEFWILPGIDIENGNKKLIFGMNILF